MENLHKFGSAAVEWLGRFGMLSVRNLNNEASHLAFQCEHWCLHLLTRLQVVLFTRRLKCAECDLRFIPKYLRQRTSVRSMNRGGWYCPECIDAPPGWCTNLCNEHPTDPQVIDRTQRLARREQRLQRQQEAANKYYEQYQLQQVCHHD